MNSAIEYNGHVIEPTTRAKGTPSQWTLEVRIAPVGQDTEARRCRAPNMYPTKARAVVNCLEFGRRIVDGKMRPRTTRGNGD